MNASSGSGEWPSVRMSGLCSLTLSDYCLPSCLHIAKFGFRTEGNARTRANFQANQNQKCVFCAFQRCLWHRCASQQLLLDCIGTAQATEGALLFALGRLFG